MKFLLVSITALTEDFIIGALNSHDSLQPRAPASQATYSGMQTSVSRDISGINIDKVST